eukprot:TRINITY_DN4578_c0_g1_i1.p1 TRINITY_DN4578_c0_g1~~TRINITY_DN4578_c0_g1_i1.p1  ORF type:complete len:337 (+),score=35.23 TRINITY_DN4578_c0_g1_i1:63-1013(+)
MKAPVPIVDLSQPQEQCATLIRQACTQHGFFYIINHQVPKQEIEEMFDLFKAFFALPKEEKEKILINKKMRGYTPPQDQILDPENQSMGDIKEGIYIGREISVDHPHYAWPFYGPNQWPDEKLLPNFRQLVENYKDKMTQLGFKMMELLALSLELPSQYFKPMFDHPIFSLRPVHYFGDVSVPEEGKFGAGAHTDWGLCTILATDGVPGLQIQYQNEWLDVEHVEDAFVINLGDMVQRWTNDMYKSTLHRVVLKTNQDRYSLPFFLDADFDAIVECIPSCAGESGPKYPKTSVGQYLVDKINQTTTENLQDKLAQL